VCGTLGHARPHQPPVHFLALYEVASRTVLAQRAVQSKEHERDWWGIEQVFRIERVVRKQELSRRQVVYGITNLFPQQAGLGEIGQLVRAYWAIENRLHWRRDVTLREDASQVRTAQVPAIVALLNSAVLALMD